MDNKEVSPVSEDKEVTSVDSKEKSNLVIQVIGAAIFLIIAVIISWFLGMNDVEKIQNEQNNNEVKEKIKEDKEEKIPALTEEVKLAIDTAKGEEFSTNLDYILQNVFTDINHLVPDSNRNSANLLSDEVIKFKIVYYIAERYGDTEKKLYNINSNGIEETGRYAIEYEYFKIYYKELIGEDFNEEVLTKVEDSFIQRGDYLFGIVLSGAKSNYELSSESFVQNEDKYYFTVLVNELDETEQITLSYKVKLELSKLNEKYIINSIEVA